MNKINNYLYRKKIVVVDGIEMEIKELLKKKIMEDAIIIKPDIINVAGFINHQVDVRLMLELARLFVDRFKSYRPNKILTVEASGIIPAGMVAYLLGVPLVYAKKKLPSTLGKEEEVYSRNVYSKTRGERIPLAISRAYLHEEDRMLIIDDFLASGGSALGLIDIIHEAEAEICGYGGVIEKVFEGGRRKIEDKGIGVFSIIKIESIEDGIKFGD